MITLNLSRPISNGKEGILHIPRVSELEPHYWMQFSAIPRIPPLGKSYPPIGDAVCIFPALPIGSKNFGISRIEICKNQMIVI